MEINKDQEGRLSTSLYRKSTGNTILHYSIFHPKPLKDSSPYSQYLRLRRNCSDPMDYKTKADELRLRLQSQGFSILCLKKAYKRAHTVSRETLLYNNKEKTTLPTTSQDLLTTTPNIRNTEDLGSPLAITTGHYLQWTKP